MSEESWKYFQSQLFATVAIELVREIRLRRLFSINNANATTRSAAFRPNPTRIVALLKGPMQPHFATQPIFTPNKTSHAENAVSVPIVTQVTIRGALPQTSKTASAISKYGNIFAIAKGSQLGRTFIALIAATVGPILPSSLKTPASRKNVASSPCATSSSEYSKSDELLDGLLKAAPNSSQRSLIRYSIAISAYFSSGIEPIPKCN